MDSADSTKKTTFRLCPACIQKLTLIISAVLLFVAYKMSWQDTIDSAMVLLDSPYPDLLLDFIHAHSLHIAITSLLLWLLQAVLFPLSAILLFQTHIALFGVIGGMLFSCLMMLLGACINFWIAKILSRGIEKFFEKDFLENLKQRIEGQEIKCIIALRLLPLPCFDVISYLAGMSGCSFKNYVIGSALGMIPAVVFYSYLFTEHNFIELGFYVIGCILCISLMLHIKHIIMGTAMKNMTHNEAS